MSQAKSHYEAFFNPGHVSLWGLLNWVEWRLPTGVLKLRRDGWVNLSPGPGFSCG